MVAALRCVRPQFQWYQLAYATEMKSNQLHDSIEGLSQKIVSITLHYSVYTEVDVVSVLGNFIDTNIKASTKTNILEYLPERHTCQRSGPFKVVAARCGTLWKVARPARDTHVSMLAREINRCRGIRSVVTIRFVAGVDQFENSVVILQSITAITCAMHVYGINSY